MSEISKSDLGIIEERLPVVIDQFENFNHIGSGTFSKVYVANIKVGFRDFYYLCYSTVGVHLPDGHFVRISQGQHRDDDHRECATHFTCSHS